MHFQQKEKEGDENQRYWNSDNLLKVNNKVLDIQQHVSNTWGTTLERGMSTIDDLQNSEGAEWNRKIKCP